MIYRADAQLGADLYDEIVVDLFAGGGGASVGIEAALGRCVDVAVNHDPEAVAMHRANHPHTLHLTCDVFEVDPVEATGGRPVGLLWASPDCTFFSKARGSKPIRHPNRKRRALAWVVVKWARAVRPRVIMLENVEEFAQWGPLMRDGRPCPVRKGRTFNRWRSMLQAEGYAVEWRTLRACDYGAPTIRKRLFLVARCDGESITWPEVTHGELGAGNRRPRRAQPTGARQTRGEERFSCNGMGAVGDEERADRSQHCGPEQVASRSRQQRRRVNHPHPYRTAAECIDWSLPCPSIFERRKPLAEATLRRIARGIVRYVLQASEPFIVELNHHGGDRTHTTRKPLLTVQASSREGKALVVPSVVSISNYGGNGAPARAADEPLSTVTAWPRGGHHALVSAFLAKHYGGNEGPGWDLRRPISTVTSQDHHHLTAAHLVKLRGTCRDGQDLREPAPTITSGGNHAGLVAALLVKFYGNDREGLNLACPLHTVTTKDRFGLITCTVEGETYIIVDIGMRMLQPHELYAAQGFPRGYIHGWGVMESGDRLTLTKSAQVRLCGNSVSPPVPEALVRANLLEHPHREAVMA